MLVVDSSVPIVDPNPMARKILGIEPDDGKASVKLPAVWRAARKRLRARTCPEGAGRALTHDHPGRASHQ